MIFKNSKVYDVLKWIAIICLPALVIAIPELFTIWNIPYGAEIGKTLQVISVLLGTLLGVSNIQYNKKEKEEIEDGGVI